jgi:hypothetical protein
MELIKDYDLEVHYHPGKANVVADALSRKAHCYCLSAASYNETLCSEMWKLRLEMIPQGSLNHISIEPTLHDHIIMAQLHDEGVRSSSRNCLTERRSTNVFVRITREFYGLKVSLSFEKSRTRKANS